MKRGLGGFSPYAQFLQISFYGNFVIGRNLELLCKRSLHCVQILHDVTVLSYGYPIYTKPGEGGGIFIMDSYKPYNNTLTLIEQERLKKSMMWQRGRIKNFATCPTKV